MKKSTKVISISMFPEDIEALKALCLIEQRTASNMIQILVRQEMKEREKERVTNG